MTYQPQGISQYQFAKTRFVFDDSIFPFFGLRHYGPGNPDTLRLLYQVRKPVTDYASKHGKKVVMIYDIEQMQVPDAVSRKGVAEIAKVAETSPGFATTIVIVPNPLLRGVVTALAWMGVTALTSASSTQDAIRQGSRLLNDDSIEVDQYYQLPEWDDKREIINIKPSDVVWTVDDVFKVV